MQRKKLKEHMKPDENAMTVGMVNIMLTAFTVGRWPQSFFILHLIKTTVLLPWRYVRFRRQKYQWYLVEFCYFVSYATLIGCFLALFRTSTGYETALTDYNHLLFRVGFSFATGPLVSPLVLLHDGLHAVQVLSNLAARPLRFQFDVQVWSVFIFQNSIVLHDIDQLTSLFIHL